MMRKHYKLFISIGLGITLVIFIIILLTRSYYLKVGSYQYHTTLYNYLLSLSKDESYFKNLNDFLLTENLNQKLSTIVNIKIGDLLIRDKLSNINGIKLTYLTKDIENLNLSRINILSPETKSNNFDYKLEINKKDFKNYLEQKIFPLLNKEKFPSYYTQKLIYEKDIGFIGIEDDSYNIKVQLEEDNDLEDMTGTQQVEESKNKSENIFKILLDDLVTEKTLSENDFLNDTFLEIPYSSPYSTTNNLEEKIEKLYGEISILVPKSNYNYLKIQDPKLLTIKFGNDTIGQTLSFFNKTPFYKLNENYLDKEFKYLDEIIRSNKLLLTYNKYEKLYKKTITLRKVTFLDIERLKNFLLSLEGKSIFDIKKVELSSNSDLFTETYKNRVDTEIDVHNKDISYSICEGISGYTQKEDTLKERLTYSIYRHRKVKSYLEGKILLSKEGPTYNKELTHILENYFIPTNFDLSTETNILYLDKEQNLDLFGNRNKFDLSLNVKGKYRVICRLNENNTKYKFSLMLDDSKVNLLNKTYIYTQN